MAFPQTLHRSSLSFVSALQWGQRTVFFFKAVMIVFASLLHLFLSG